jgi:hypothetical protein
MAGVAERLVRDPLPLARGSVRHAPRIHRS